MRDTAAGIEIDAVTKLYGDVRAVDGVTLSVPPGALAINSSPQQNVEGWVARRRPGTPSAEAAARALDAGPSGDGISFSHENTPVPEQGEQ